MSAVSPQYFWKLYSRCVQNCKYYSRKQICSFYFSKNVFENKSTFYMVFKWSSKPELIRKKKKNKPKPWKSKSFNVCPDVQHCIKHFKRGYFSPFNSAVYFIVVHCGEPVRLALRNLPALFLVSIKLVHPEARITGWSQNNTVAEWTWWWKV